MFSSSLKIACLVCLLLTESAIAQVLPDPTQPANRPTAGSGKDKTLDGFPAVSLQAIFNRDQRTYAIVNGETLAVGDSFEDFAVVAITDAGITLSGKVRGNTVQREFLIDNNSDIKKDSSNDF